MTSDPAGYFVIYVDRVRGTLSLEHFGTNGVLDMVIEGRAAAEIYVPAIEKRLVSRLDHAAYLGRELARAEAALLAGAEYVQDGAPERPPNSRVATSCDCGDASSGDSP
jgi:tetrahydromethanopterin S-methyltransferase subunit A